MAIKNNISRKKTNHQHTGFLWILIIGLFFSELLIHTWVRTESTQTLLRVSKVEQALIRELSYQKDLLLEKGRLKSDDRITRIAKTRLNLTAATAIQTVYLKGDER